MNRLSSLTRTGLKGLADFTWGDFSTGLCIGLPLLAMINVVSVHHWFAAIVSGFAFAAAAIGRRKFVESLERRLAERNSLPRWFVRVNGVEVGSLSDADYAMAWLQTVQSPKGYLQQSMNVVNVVFSIIRGYLETIPLLLVGGILFFGATMPDVLGHWLVAMRDASEAEITAYVAISMRMLTVLLTLAFVMSMMISQIFSKNGTLGFRNAFMDIAVEDARRMLDIAATGEVSVTPVCIGFGVVKGTKADREPRA